MYEINQQQSWERERWSTTILVNLELPKNKKIKPQDLTVFPWEKKHKEAKLTKEQAKATANGFIKQFNWLVERSIYDSSKTIPSAVGTYVGDIKTDCAAIEAAIDAASDMAAFKKLYDWEYNEDGSVKTIAPIQNWIERS